MEGLLIFLRPLTQKNNIQSQPCEMGSLVPVFIKVVFVEFLTMRVLV